jgi:hypothetical protein
VLQNLSQDLFEIPYNVFDGLHRVANVANRSPDLSYSHCNGTTCDFLFPLLPLLFCLLYCLLVWQDLYLLVSVF